MPLGLVFIQLHVTLHLHHLEEGKGNISLDTAPSVPPGLLCFCSPSMTLKILFKTCNSNCQPDLPPAHISRNCPGGAAEAQFSPTSSYKLSSSASGEVGKWGVLCKVQLWDSFTARMNYSASFLRPTCRFPLESCQNSWLHFSIVLVHVLEGWPILKSDKSAKLKSQVLLKWNTGFLLEPGLHHITDHSNALNKYGFLLICLSSYELTKWFTPEVILSGKKKEGQHAIHQPRKQET